MYAYTPVRGKCVYWREAANMDDEYDITVKKPDKRVEGSCFVEGDLWRFTVSTAPKDCPNYLSCRYYIKST